MHWPASCTDTQTPGSCRSDPILRQGGRGGIARLAVRPTRDGTYLRGRSDPFTGSIWSAHVLFRRGARRSRNLLTSLNSWSSVAKPVQGPIDHIAAVSAARFRRSLARRGPGDRPSGASLYVAACRPFGWRKQSLKDCDSSPPVPVDAPFAKIFTGRGLRDTSGQRPCLSWAASVRGSLYGAEASQFRIAQCLLVAAARTTAQTARRCRARLLVFLRAN